MELTKDEINKKHAKHCRHCHRNTILPYGYENTYFSSGYNVIKRNHKLSEIRRNKNLSID